MDEGLEAGFGDAFAAALKRSSSSSSLKRLFEAEEADLGLSRFESG